MTEKDISKEMVMGYGMLGQAVPTTLPGQVTATSPYGRDVKMLDSQLGYQK